MNTEYRTVIVGTGSYIPTEIISNDFFLNNVFYDPSGTKIQKSNPEIVEKLRAITGIEERRYVSAELVTSDIAYFSAIDALDSSGIDPESLDCIIVAHNFGDVTLEGGKSDFVPSLAARVKRRLEIRNPYSVAFDIPFGCPGWLQGLIQANYALASGAMKRALVIGAETLSRVSDPHDQDSMIYSDGAGAVILEAVPTKDQVGVLSYVSRSDAVDYGNLLFMGNSNNPDYHGDRLFLKMEGHKLYKYALKTVPAVVKKCLDEAGLTLSDIKKVFLHQANGKMDVQITKRIFDIYGLTGTPVETINDIMPLTISWLGNSSVATVPTLYDLVLKHKLPGHEVNPGDNIIFASVGAGMNINAVAYKIPETADQGSARK